MATRKCGNIYFRKNLFPEIFYCRQEVHKYFGTSVNINGRFTRYIIPRLLHIKKCTDRPTVAAPKCQPSEDEPLDHDIGKKKVFL